MLADCLGAGVRIFVLTTIMPDNTITLTLAHVRRLINNNSVGEGKKFYTIDSLAYIALSYSIGSFIFLVL